ncbi:hypothetical protein CRM22_007573 [Opisthorchis felineus]|uniref:Uncharacterized protein n=1 Tax=Opisthorchis felineus TaxID=147828 RepID=A0A4S2LFN6_OPIFE|nr:hypothetical protein CRM22_007573 [Opisthorchis felineus]
MEIPEDDSDLLGKTATEIESDLKNRDVIMQHGLVEELTGPRLFGTSKPVDEIIASSTPWTRIRQLFNSDPMLSDTDLSKTGSRAIRLPLAIGAIVGVGVGLARLLTAYDEFVRANRLTAWRTREIAKFRAADYSAFKAITFGLSTGLKATFLAAGCYIFFFLWERFQQKFGTV